MLHALATGSRAGRCRAARLMCAAYAFLAVNQLATDWSNATLARLVVTLAMTVWIHDTVCPRKPREGRSRRHKGQRESQESKKEGDTKPRAQVREERNEHIS